MIRHDYRIAIQLDRAWCVDGEGRPDFEDPDEVRVAEITFVVEAHGKDEADKRASAAMEEIAATIDAILRRHGLPRSDADAKRGA